MYSYKTSHHADTMDYIMPNERSEVVGVRITAWVRSRPLYRHNYTISIFKKNTRFEPHLEILRGLVPKKYEV